MLKLGLTGGIASGKSVVAAILRELGFPVLDADSISHKLMEPGQTAHHEILQSFGADLAGSSGNIDRHKLAAIVFADPANLRSSTQSFIRALTNRFPPARRLAKKRCSHRGLRRSSLAHRSRHGRKARRPRRRLVHVRATTRTPPRSRHERNRSPPPHRRPYCRSKKNSSAPPTPSIAPARSMKPALRFRLSP